MRKFRMPFEYWEDEHTKLLRKTKPPEFLDPDFYVEAHWHFDSDGNGPYFLNRRCLALMNKHGPFRNNYHDGEKLVDRHWGLPAFIFAPGPSLEEVDFAAFDGDLVTMALNSAGFRVAPRYWVMAESSYAKWLLGERYPPHRCIIATARVAVMLRAEEVKKRRTKWDPVYVVRWEEEKIVPPRTPAVSLSNALVSAWEMGCPVVYLLGVDLSKPKRPYVEGVPYTKEGAANAFDDQILAIRQFQLPDFRIVNGSPHSKDVLPFEYLPYSEIEEHAKAAR